MAADDYRDETGEEILRALRSPAAGAIREALAGCRFYRDDPEDLVDIVAVPAGERALITRRDGLEQRLPYALFEQGYVIPNSPSLRAALAAARSPEDERLERAATVLARHRIKASAFSTDDRLTLAEALDATEANLLPDMGRRLRSYQLLRDGGFHRQAIPLLQRWSDMLSPESLETFTTVIELAACYRHSGQIERALDTTTRLAARATTMPSSTRAVFACEHAAILMDMFEQDQDGRRLAEARQWAGVAWRLDPSDYVSQLYQRLKSLEAKE
jgi:tetratricopeptide (TPR) repeat protein